MLINIRNIIDKLYPDKSGDELIVLLEEHHLFDLLKKTEIQLNELINEKESLRKKYKVLPIGALIANQLICVNTKLKTCPNEQRVALEQLMSDITFSIFRELADCFGHMKAELFDHIAFALEKTCEFQGYDKFQLLNYLKIDKAVSYQSAIQTGEKIKKAQIFVPKLTWEGNPMQFNAFLLLFKERSLLAKSNSFAKLFSDPDRNLKISFNEERSDITLQLLDFLKKKKLISCSPCRSIYVVLKYHVLDFEEKILKNKSPRLRMNALKNSKKKWADNQAIIEKWTTGIE
ncbi:MAG: hypothetical protein ACOYLG_01210 [Chitinophagaceae bacterium]